MGTGPRQVPEPGRSEKAVEDGRKQSKRSPYKGKQSRCPRLLYYFVSFVNRIAGGKGNRKRLVRFGTSLARHFQQYMAWKEKAGESTEPQACVFLSSNTGRHMTRRAIQKVFKKAVIRAGLPEHYSIHCCRHTYACELYRASGYNLRLVQKQLGHSNSRITEVYADIFNPDTEKSLEKLYK